MKISVNGKDLFFDVGGPGYMLEGARLRQLPTLILIHGSPGNSDHSVFKPAFSTLHDCAQVIYLDLAGSGRSDDEPDDAFSLERWADDLVEFCRLLDVEKPVVLGVSGGGFVAMTYGIRYPDHPGKLMLASTQAKLDVERTIAEFRRLGGEEAEAAAREFLTRGVDRQSSAKFGLICIPLYNPNPQPPRDTIIFRPKLAMAFHKLDGIWHRMDLLDDLGKIKAPTLVMAGEEDPITPLQDSVDIVDRMPKNVVQFASFAHAGHWPDTERV